MRPKLSGESQRESLSWQCEDEKLVRLKSSKGGKGKTRLLSR